MDSYWIGKLDAAVTDGKITGADADWIKITATAVARLESPAVRHAELLKARYQFGHDLTQWVLRLAGLPPRFLDDEPPPETADYLGDKAEALLKTVAGHNALSDAELLLIRQVVGSLRGATAHEKFELLSTLADAWDKATRAIVAYAWSSPENPDYDLRKVVREGPQRLRLKDNPEVPFSCRFSSNRIIPSPFMTVLLECLGLPEHYLSKKPRSETAEDCEARRKRYGQCAHKQDLIWAVAASRG